MAVQRHPHCGGATPTYIARCHGHVKSLEEGAMGESAGHVLRDERCGHGPIVAPPRRDKTRAQVRRPAIDACPCITGMHRA
jgi:hypothetical protein